MLWSWRSWILILLFLGPFAAYIGLGFLWLLERGWIVTTSASLAWIASGVVLYALGARWTKGGKQILPPIDWASPGTFAPADRAAWAIVHEEAEKGETIAMEPLVGLDLYMDTGRRLANRLAKHYHPLSENPIETVPVIELLTALELAAEDLNGLCRQVPGGDLITAGHWKTAVQAAGYIQKANSIYSYILPLLNPATGLPRLASQHLMIKPAWKSMQENMLRWFYQAFVNRLGVHLIELYSGRLVIGANQYRRLTKRMGKGAVEATSGEAGPLTIAVAGSRGSGVGRLVEAVRLAGTPGGEVGLAKLKGAGLDGPTLDRLLGANWVEVVGYTAKPDRETARDRSTRRHAVAEAVEADLLLLLIDDRRATLTADAAFAKDWDRWYVEHPALDRPPLVAAVLTPEPARVDLAKAALPPTIGEVVAVGATIDDPLDLARAILPTLGGLLPRAERAAILHQLQRLSARSKTGRLLRQVGDQGRTLWGQIRRPKPGAAPTEQATKI